MAWGASGVSRQHAGTSRNASISGCQQRIYGVPINILCTVENIGFAIGANHEMLRTRHRPSASSSFPKTMRSLAAVIEDRNSPQKHVQRAWITLHSAERRMCDSQAQVKLRIHRGLNFAPGQGIFRNCLVWAWDPAGSKLRVGNR